MVIGNPPNRYRTVTHAAMAIKTCAKVKLCGHRANTSVSWQLRVFNCSIESKLMYVLETIQLRQREKVKSNAVLMKCTRRILKIPQTFIDRSQTNQAVRDQATQYGVNLEKDMLK